jgi:transcriptional regulator with XRE-family HTH domain
MTKCLMSQGTLHMTLCRQFLYTEKIVESQFAEWLKQAREASGLSGNMLADRSGVDQSTVSKLESGVRNPSPEMIDSLAAALAGEGAEEADVLRLSRAGRRAAFLPDDDNDPDLPDDEMALLERYRGMTPNGKTRYVKMADLIEDPIDVVGGERPEEVSGLGKVGQMEWLRAGKAKKD